MMIISKFSGALLRSFIAASIFLAGLALEGNSQPSSEDLQTKVDALILTAYHSASAEFPCKLKTRGKPKMLRWQQVDKCLNDANDRVDWEGLSRRLQEIRDQGGYQSMDIASAIDASLSAHEIPYDKVFLVKDIKALLPLSNSLLKFLPYNSLIDLPVYGKSGERIGKFSGVYTYERSGGLVAANSYRLSFFQYTDANGDTQTPSTGGRLLLDSYGVPWKDAESQPGFRLSSDRLNLKR